MRRLNITGSRIDSGAGANQQNVKRRITDKGESVIICGMRDKLAYKDDRNMLAERGVMRDRFDPLLVCLHDSTKGYSETRDKKSFECLVHSVTAILDARLSESERILAADVLISLMRQAERDLRQSLVERLAIKDNLPQSMLHFLAYGDIEMAEPVLLYSPLLSDTDLLYIIQSKAEDHWRVIAKRSGIGESVCDLLATKPDSLTHVNLLQNDSVTLSADALTNVKESVIRSQSEKLAENLVSYKRLPKDVAVSLYWYVSTALREKIAMTHAIEKDDIFTALEDCTQDFADTMFYSNTAELMPSKLMVEAAHIYAEKGRISGEFLVGSLRKRQGRFFIALMAQKSGLLPKIVLRMMKQTGGQGLAVTCRALNIGKEDFVSMFLLARAIVNARETVQSDELKMAMRYYDGLTHKMAKDILTESIVR